MMQCPACDHKEYFLKQMISHVSGRHLGTVQQLYDRKLRDYSKVRCWCGETLNSRGDWVADHFRKHGGLRAHYLACALGVEENDGR